MATIIVDTTLDENDGSITDGDVSLRDAIAAASDGDTITFASGAGEAFENGGTIRLSQDLGELVIASDVTIDGDLDDDAAPDVTVTGDTLGDDETTTDPLGNTITNGRPGRHEDNVRVLNVTGGSSTIDGLVITGGVSGSNDTIAGGVHVAEDAALSLINTSVSGHLSSDGAIYNAGLLTLTNSVLSSNFSYHGGGLHNDGIATLIHTTVSGNVSDAKAGGGVYNGGTMTLTNTTVSGNTASRDGGVSNGGTLTLTNTTVSGNSSSGRGAGGIGNDGILSLADSVVSDNNSADGTGGVANSSTATLSSTTVSGNSSSFGSGGGISNPPYAALTLTNTTVSDNSAYWSGGGIHNRGNVTLANTTVWGNYAALGGGGGMFNGGTATLTNTTVSGNTNRGDGGGGISNSGAATLTNTVVLGNNAPNSPEVSGAITESGPNIIGGNAADVFAETVDNNGVAAGLLADNGGAVQTIALENDPSNPALDAGQDDRLDESVAGLDLNGDGDTDDVIDTDARGSGFDRFVDLPDVANNGANTVDLGAYEVQADEASEADCVEVSFVSEDAGYRSSYGWYDTGTLEARILVANVDTATNPDLETFSAGLPLSPKELETLGFFLIPNGYNQNSDPGEPFAEGDGTDLDLEVFKDGVGWKVRDTASGYVFQGSGNPAYFTDPGMNPGGLDHVMETGDLAAAGSVTHAWEDLPDLGDADFDDAVFEVETNYTVEVTFVSEDAGYQSTYGWYHTGTGGAEILVANVDTHTNPDLADFTATLSLTADEIEHLGFFLIPDGYNQNSDPGEPFAEGDGTDLDLEVFKDAGVWKIRDTDSGYVFQGSGNPAYFTETDKNPAGNDHVMEDGDLMADGAVTHNWEDLPDLGDQDFNDVVFDVSLGCAPGEGDVLDPGSETLMV